MTTEERTLIKIISGISRARDTYGYRLVGLREKQENGRWRRIAWCNGGGYDMEATVLGMWLEYRFQARLKRLPDKWTGLTFYQGKAIVDGGTGWNGMYQLANAIGVNITEMTRTSRETIYAVTIQPEEEVFDQK